MRYQNYASLSTALLNELSSSSEKVSLIPTDLLDVILSDNKKLSDKSNHRMLPSRQSHVQS